MYEVRSIDNLKPNANILLKWLRAEILGAFFNAVFLIALCLSIILEAITRLLDPPEISNSKLILIVGSLGLASNLVGFFVLGGHAHKETEHDDTGDDIQTAEEGYGGQADVVEPEYPGKLSKISHDETFYYWCLTS